MTIGKFVNIRFVYFSNSLRNISVWFQARLAITSLYSGEAGLVNVCPQWA